jgi:hypothetical protein
MSAKSELLEFKRQELQTCTHIIEASRSEIEQQNSRIQQLVTEMAALEAAPT